MTVTVTRSQLFKSVTVIRADDLAATDFAGNSYKLSVSPAAAGKPASWNLSRLSGTQQSFPILPGGMVTAANLNSMISKLGTAAAALGAP
jgi:hypothetical protein